jgi:hypothetical protein
MKYTHLAFYKNEGMSNVRISETLTLTVKEGVHNGTDILIISHGSNNRYPEIVL